jgi:ribosome-binding protein aMBF1 (putative translation factor)
MSSWYLLIEHPLQYISMSHQDWETVQWRKTKALTAAEAKRRALPTGVVQKRKDDGGLGKVARTEIGDIKKWGKKRGKALATARTQKALSQTNLAKKLNVKPAIIAACEAGKAPIDQKLLARMRKELGPFDKGETG